MDTQNSSTGSFKRYWRLLVMLLLLLLITAELFVRLIVVKLPRSTPALINRVYQATGDQVVAGDSQMYRAFLEQQDFVNLARRGNPIPAVKLTLEKYFSNKKPSRVVLQASPQLFSKPQLERNTQRYDAYFNLNMAFYKPYLFEKGITEFINEIKSVSQAYQLLMQSQPPEFEASSQAWLAMTEQQRSNRVRARVEHHMPQWQDNRTADYQRIYRELISGLLSKQAIVCLVRPPVNAEYLAITAQSEAYLQAELFFLELARDYNVRYVDFQELPIDFEESAFINQDHITPAASKTFSALVFSRCFDPHSSSGNR